MLELGLGAIRNESDERNGVNFLLIRVKLNVLQIFHDI